MILTVLFSICHRLRGHSLNEGIPKELYSVKYSSFDDAVALVRSLGMSAFMAKLDIKHAFRLCLIRPDLWDLSRLLLAG